MLPRYAINISVDKIANAIKCFVLSSSQESGINMIDPLAIIMSIITFSYLFQNSLYMAGFGI